MNMSKGDVCALEVEVMSVDDLKGSAIITYEAHDGRICGASVDTSRLKVLRPAPVDLATCPLPAQATVDGDNPARQVTVLARNGDVAWVRERDGSHSTVLLSCLRPVAKSATNFFVMLPVPEPLKEPPEKGTAYWCVSDDFDDLWWSEWDGRATDQRRLQDGRVFATREAAVAALMEAAIRARGSE
ncbi:hypothetical protein ACFFJB_14855 [Camelimonas abortus]|uniref:Uncharacterized protein n=1 Tax=Camelimonas abortus TaxID=1017184 RepID=A0ABV7LJ95_9HYPH